MRSRFPRSVAVKVMRRDSRVTNGCSASDGSCPICGAVLMLPAEVPSVAPSAHYVCLLIQINDQDHRTKVALTVSPLRLAIDLTRPLRVTRGNQRRETTQNGSGKRSHPRGRN